MIDNSLRLDKKTVESCAAAADDRVPNEDEENGNVSINQFLARGY